jgi:hypothetical protein
MSNYSDSSVQKKSSISKPKELSPIWRGIGCMMILGIPVISIAAGVATVQLVLDNKWGIIPRQLLGHPRLPDIFYKSSGLMYIFNPLTKIKDFYADAVVSLIYILLISGIISVIYSAIYNIVGPSRYGPTDEPPIKTRRTKKSR